MLFYLMEAWVLIILILGIIGLIIGLIFYVLPYFKIKSISKLYYKKWNEITDQNKENLKKLGWKEDTWDTTNRSVLTNYPDSYKKKMSELTEDEKKGAKGIGHNSFSWNLQKSFGFSKKD